MARSMLLRNSHVRGFDKFFDDVWSHGFRNPFAVMDSVLESITKPIPLEPGTKFTVYKMVSVEYAVTENEDSLIETLPITAAAFCSSTRLSPQAMIRTGRSSACRNTSDFAVWLSRL